MTEWQDQHYWSDVVTYQSSNLSDWQYYSIWQELLREWSLEDRQKFLAKWCVCLREKNTSRVCSLDFSRLKFGWFPLIWLAFTPFLLTLMTDLNEAGAVSLSPDPWWPTWNGAGVVALLDKMLDSDSLCTLLGYQDFWFNYHYLTLAQNAWFNCLWPRGVYWHWCVLGLMSFLVCSINVANPRVPHLVLLNQAFLTDFFQREIHVQFSGKFRPENRVIFQPEKKLETLWMI
jgi:hypothetical protein